MTLLFRVIYAAHAKGTHHKLALDALHHLDGEHAEDWRRLLLKHADVLMLGAKAPDDEFKDFVNHVLHPRDGFWGGAPAKARSWYGHLVTALRQRDWSTASYAAGVLSHYVTDPIHPFHTGQSEAENNIHRAVEWSINRAYDGLRTEALGLAPAPEIVVAEADNWLEVLVCDGASESNRHYKRLIAHYDINRGVVDPPSGLDPIARRLVGGLILLASAIFGRVLQKAIDEAGVPPPKVDLTLATVMATIKIPLKQLEKRLADSADRQQVQAMYDELRATGRVEANLPKDDRMVRERYAREVLARQVAAEPASLFPFRAGPPVETSVERAERLRRENTERAKAAAAARVAERAIMDSSRAPPSLRGTAATEPPAPTKSVPSLGSYAGLMSRLRTSGKADEAAQGPPPPLPGYPAPSARTEPTIVSKPTENAPATRPVPTSVVPMLLPAGSSTTSVPITRPPRLNTVDEPAPAQPVAVGESAIVAAASIIPSRQPRTYLKPEDAVVDAPSIGPQTARRLEGIGIRTAAELLAANPETIAKGLSTRHVTPAVVKDWQDQTRLVIEVPELRGTHAQLLVGAGFRSRSAVAEADPGALCARVLAFAASPDGQRVLRNGDPPDMERIKAWVGNARLAEAA